MILSLIFPKFWVLKTRFEVCDLVIAQAPSKWRLCCYSQMDISSVGNPSEIWWFLYFLGSSENVAVLYLIRKFLGVITVEKRLKIWMGKSNKGTLDIVFIFFQVDNFWELHSRGEVEVQNIASWFSRYFLAFEYLILFSAKTSLYCFGRMKKK